MSSKSISELAPNLFSRARQLELLSIVQRAGLHRDDSAHDHTEPMKHTTAQSREDDRSLRIRAMNKLSVGCSKLRPLSDCASPVFHLVATANGCWEIREEQGTKVGWFRTRQAAIKYARDESPNGNFVIIDDLSGIE